jgi:site-specific DNA-methyltransferase (adenine-specific)
MKVLLHGDCLEQIKTFKDNSIDSIVTDPPYGLSFMGKKWDYDVPSVDVWKECLRVLKPGGHLLSFSGSRTYHRMAVRIEDAGFEIRDQIMWVYGSGFPKSHNLGEGWGTALKPAHEPIVMARKPFKGNVAQNVLEWGTGGLNIDESRIGDKNGRWPANIMFDEEAGQVLDEQSGISKGNKPGSIRKGTSNFLSNFETEQSERTGYNDLGGASRFFYCPKASKKDRDEGLNDFPDYDKYADTSSDTHSFSHMVKEGKQVLVKNNHPTVKPTELMLYLIKLVTPKGGTVLEPFMGSGSTGKAAIRGGFDFIGIEKEEEYLKIAEARIEHEYGSKH